MEMTEKEDKPSKLPPSQWKRGINSLKDDLRFDVSWGFGIKDKKLLDTVMDRVMETIDVWQMRMIAEKQEPSIPIKKIEEKIKEVESWRLIHNEAIFIDLLKSLLPKK